MGRPEIVSVPAFAGAPSQVELDYPSRLTSSGAGGQAIRMWSGLPRWQALTWPWASTTSSRARRCGSQSPGP